MSANKRATTSRLAGKRQWRALGKQRSAPLLFPFFSRALKVQFCSSARVSPISAAITHLIQPFFGFLFIFGSSFAWPWHIGFRRVKSFLGEKLCRYRGKSKSPLSEGLFLAFPRLSERSPRLPLLFPLLPTCLCHLPFSFSYFVWSAHCIPHNIPGLRSKLCWTEEL